MAVKLMQKISPLITPMFLISMVSLSLVRWLANDNAFGNFAALFSLVLTSICMLMMLVYIGITLYGLYDLYRHCHVPGRQIWYLLYYGVLLRLLAAINHTAAFVVRVTRGNPIAATCLNWIARKAYACKDQLERVTDAIVITIEENP